MAVINLNDERKRFKKFYQKWKFLRHIVDLYAEGVSWKGCKLIAPAEPDKIPVQYSQIIDIDAIKDGAHGMLVDGTGDFNLKVLDSVHPLPILMPRVAPTEEPGRSFLWRPTINAEALEIMLSASSTSPDALHVAAYLDNDMCAGLGVPRRLLEPTAATVNADIIMNGLSTFIGRVEQLRKHLAFHIEEAVKPLIFKALAYDGWIKVEWNENWLQHEIAVYGPIYQVFKTQGVELRTLRQEVLNAAKSLLDNSLIPRQTYEQWIKWFRD